MSAIFDSLQGLASAASLKSAELANLLALIHEMEIDAEAGDDCPEYVNVRSISAARSAAILMAELLEGLNSDLEVSLRMLARNNAENAVQPVERGSK